MNKRWQALGRLPKGKMNQTEARYAARLELLKRSGEILWYMFEPANLRLADNTYYRPDFMVMTKDFALQVHEVKGRWTDDARAKIKIAAELFPFAFMAVYEKKNKAAVWYEFEGFNGLG